MTRLSQMKKFPVSQVLPAGKAMAIRIESIEGIRIRKMNKYTFIFRVKNGRIRSPPQCGTRRNLIHVCKHVWQWRGDVFPSPKTRVENLTSKFRRENRIITHSTEQIEFTIISNTIGLYIRRQKKTVKTPNLYYLEKNKKP